MSRTAGNEPGKVFGFPRSEGLCVREFAFELSENRGVAARSVGSGAIEKRVQELVVNDPRDKRCGNARVVERGVDANEAVQGRVASETNRATAPGTASAPGNLKRCRNAVEARSEAANDVAHERREIVGCPSGARVESVRRAGRWRKHREGAAERSGARSRWALQKLHESAQTGATQVDELPTHPHKTCTIGARRDRHEARAVVGPCPNDAGAQRG
jgi:hypothetical protein